MAYQADMTNVHPEEEKTSTHQWVVEKTSLNVI